MNNTECIRWTVKTIKFLLDTNIRLRLLFSTTLSFPPFLNVTDQVSQPDRTNGNVIVLYILIFKFLDIIPEDESADIE